MKILWIAKAAAFVGGAERHIADVVPLLASRGVVNSLLYDANAAVDPAFTALFDEAFPLVDAAAQIREIAPDILYIHHVSGKAATAALADTGLPTMRFFHDHAPFCLRVHKYTGSGNHSCARRLGSYCLFPCLGAINRKPGFPPVGLRTLAAARAELAENMRFDAFVVGSVYMKDHVVAHGFAPAAVRVLPMFATGPDIGQPRVRVPGLLLFVGALLRGKGLDILLSAMATLPAEVRLRVAGTGHQEAMFKAQAAKLGVSCRVDFLGKLGREALETHYKEASCVVVPSRGPETFGLVGLEAFRHGTPVVAASSGGTGDWLIEGRTGFGFPPGDATALAAVLRRVLGQPPLALAAAARGRELLSTRYSPELHIQALWNLMQSLLRQGRSS